METKKYFSREKIISKILDKLEYYIIEFRIDDINFIEKYKCNCIIFNKEISFYYKNNIKMHGKVIDISNDRELIIMSNNSHIVSINLRYKVKYLENQDYF